MRKVSLLFRIALTAVVAFAIAPSGMVRSQSKTVTTAEMAQRADVVVVGRVSGLSSEWNENRTRITTKVAVAVDQYVKGGTPGNSLTLYVPGGEVDGVGEVYSHMPTFKTNENVLVFAEKDTRGRFHVSGGREGKCLLQKDQITGRLMVSGTKSLDEFTNQIKTAVMQQQVAPEQKH